MGEARRRATGEGRVRVQTAAAEGKARRQYAELVESGQVVRALVVAELRDGSTHVLGQECTPPMAGRLLLAAADGLVHVDAQRGDAGFALRLEPHEEPAKRGEHNRQPAVRVRAIKSAEDGTLVPPYGEHFVSCGECDHPRWFVLHTTADDALARYACAHCGNEVLAVPAVL